MKQRIQFQVYVIIGASHVLGFPGGISGKETACQCRRHETQVWSLGQENPLEKEMATHSSTLAWRIPWAEEPGGLQCMGSQRFRHDSSDLACTQTRTHISVYSLLYMKKVGTCIYIKVKSQRNDHPSSVLTTWAQFEHHSAHSWQESVRAFSCNPGEVSGYSRQDIWPLSWI